jgi:hemerythrin
MLAGKGAEKLQQVVKELADYTKFHFSAEEAMLEKTSYPALAAHRAQHQDFVKRVDQLGVDLKAGKGGNSVAVLEFLKDWLTKHVKQTDQQYSAHLNANGIV